MEYKFEARKEGNYLTLTPTDESLGVDLENLQRLDALLRTYGHNLQFAGIAGQGCQVTELKFLIRD
ncbi:MAG: hypothetical protein HY518_02045 [Candidatus Aenigmarchaeota archaeon]|nr:hypothetical protein [Candidatus Aenigmarchaeota archaeon]